MNLQTILNNTQLLTDETVTAGNALVYSNKAIARINNECGTKFPFYQDINSDYPSIPSSWQFDIVGAYLAYSVKMNDGSIREADRYLEDFYRQLENFKDNIGSLISTYEAGDTTEGLNPDLVKKEGYGGVYFIDTEGAIEKGFFGRRSNGGSY